MEIWLWATVPSLMDIFHTFMEHKLNSQFKTSQSMTQTILKNLRVVAMVFIVTCVKESLQLKTPNSLIWKQTKEQRFIFKIWEASQQFSKTTLSVVIVFRPKEVLYF